MEDIAVCLVTHNDYFTTKYVIDRLLTKTNQKIRLYIIDNGSDNPQMITALQELCNINKGYFRSLPNTISYSEAINQLIRIVYQKYVVVFPANMIVHNNWLEDLIHHQTVIPSAGICSIRTGSEKTHFIPLVHNCDSKPEDELRNVHITENNLIEGIFCFKKELCDTIGLFDEKLQHKGFEQLEFSFRVASSGLNNIYIRKQSCIKLNLSNEVLYPARTKEGMQELKSQVDWMIKNQMFKK